jgi:hypothetical protein
MGTGIVGDVLTGFSKGDGTTSTGTENKNVHPIFIHSKFDIAAPSLPGAPKQIAMKHF